MIFDACAKRSSAVSVSVLHAQHRCRYPTCAMWPMNALLDIAHCITISLEHADLAVVIVVYYQDAVPLTVDIAFLENMILLRQ